MKFYKSSAFAMISVLALAGCPTDDTAEDTDSATSGADTTATDPDTTATDPDTTADGTDTADTDDSADGTDTADTDDDTDTADTDGATAQVRVIHGSPDAPAVDVYVEGDETPVIEGLAYGDASAYLEVPEGDYVFEIRAAGEAPDTDPVFATDALTLAAGDSVSAIAAGLLAGDGDAAFRVLALADGFGDAADGALARVVHAGSDAPTVGIDIGNDGDVELEGVARFADSGPEGVALTADEPLQVGIRLEDGTSVTAFSTIPIPAGAELYVIATGLLADLPRTETGFSLLAVGPDGAIGFIQQNPRVYAVHASPSAPNVDICAGGAPLLENVQYGAMGGIQVPPAAYELAVHATGDEPCAGEPAATVMTPALVPGGQTLAVAMGELDALAAGNDPDFSVQFYDEAFALDTDPAQAGIRIIHAASAPSVAIQALATADQEDFPIDEAIVSMFEHNGETGEVVLDAVQTFIGVGVGAVMGGSINVAASFTVDVPAGLRGWVLATGELDDEADNAPFGLHIVATGAGPWEIIGPVAPNPG
ncbi:MAG: DUF4397 domain-containing protein [Myxococcota bacterium]